MGIVSHHYGDLFHHFAVRLPLVAEQVHSQGGASAQLRVSCSHPAEDGHGEGVSGERKHDPANQLTLGFSSQGCLWCHGKHTRHTCSHSQHLACKRHLLKFGEWQEPVLIPVLDQRRNSRRQKRLVLNKETSVRV